MSEPETRDRSGGWSSRIAAWPLQLLLGLCWFVFGGLELLIATDRSSSHTLFSSLFLGVGVAYFVLAFVVRRKERHAIASVEREND